MKKLLLTAVALAALTLMAAPHSSYATGTVGTNGVMGLYFTGGQSCLTTPVYTPFDLYIVLMDYDATSVKAFEAGLIVSPSHSLTFLGAVYPVQATALGNNDDGGNDKNYLAGYSQPVTLPANGAGFTLVTLSVLTSVATPVSITLNAAYPSSDIAATPRPVVQLTTTSTPSLQLYTTDWAQAVGSPTVIVNNSGTCDVTLPNEDMSFGAVKSLFR